ncbi:MAG: hypothetical protein A2287_03300 [Candidatus Melainabacteria bacterium RIFOXYA12_FULL_32_12]|nr:MAG: hypothetical protein A2255_06090 [Candidatus Melainabacteria bacterium RIFOXYA2_FULL_32_9]OGI30527.1 MAG: hypothetical protein A2287_03300 [Candidatus Melainabacteria bacterium RIFOXYA12_FULL_32_12]
MLDENFQEGFEALRGNFALKLQDKLADLISFEKKLEETNYKLEVLQELYQIIHSISGSSGMFGFSEISEAAHKLEEVLKTVIKGNIIIEPKIINQIKMLLSGLKKEMG